jgi:DNA recombination protein RmuC
LIASTNLRDELSRNRDEFSKSAKGQREELSSAIKLFSDQLTSRMSDVSRMQKDQLDIFSNKLDKLTQTNEQKFDKLQEKVEAQLKELQENNSSKLEEMRRTVDEKLHDTLEKRLGESFKLVSDRLEAVREGLGEMRNLAIGVGDLKKVLTNVKTRGTWGEIQLENLIEQILTTDQYAKNLITKKNSNDRVEFAIKMPVAVQTKTVFAGCQ